MYFYRKVPFYLTHFSLIDLLKPYMQRISLSFWKCLCLLTDIVVLLQRPKHLWINFSKLWTQRVTYLSLSLSSLPPQAAQLTRTSAQTRMSPGRRRWAAPAEKGNVHNVLHNEKALRILVDGVNFVWITFFTWKHTRQACVSTAQKFSPICRSDCQTNKH